MTNETIDQVATRINFQKAGKEYKGLCKSHPDTNPSAYLVTSKKGNVYANCHVCNDAEAVSKALGIWFDPALNGNGHKASNKAACIPANIADRYEYRDAQGNVAYESVRYEEPGKEKTFKQRVPDGNGNYQWSTKGTTKYPFRLPELLAASLDEWVFIPEGEKDVNNLVKEGFVATCNVGGAAKGNWLTEYNPHFAGRKVAILPDNDVPGAKHGEEVAQNLSGIAAQVRIVALPNLPAKGDVSDWFAAGGTPDELVQLVEQTADYLAPATPPAAQQSNDLLVSEQIEAFAGALGMAFSLNEIDDRIYINGKPATDTSMAPLEVEIYNFNGLQAKGEKIPIGAVQPVVLGMSARQTFHPIRDWLNVLQWDKGRHIQNLAKYFIDSHAPITASNGNQSSVFEVMLARWLVGAVRKVYERAQNPMLVLAGPQGIGKSYLASWLAAPLGLFHGFTTAEGNSYFIEGPISPESIDHQRRLTNRFIWEVGEIGGTMGKAEINALKVFLTQGEATFRIPYAKHDITKPSICSWIGTINPTTGFLMDETGNRRFRTVELVSIDKAYSQTIDASQVWAQAVDWYRNGGTPDLSAAELKAIEEVNEQHQATTNEEEGILRYFHVSKTESGDDWAMLTSEIADFLETFVPSCKKSNGVTATGRALAKLTGRPSKRETIGGIRGTYARGVKPKDEYYYKKGMPVP